MANAGIWDCGQPYLKQHRLLNLGRAGGGGKKIIRERGQRPVAAISVLAVENVNDGRFGKHIPKLIGKTHIHGITLSNRLEWLDCTDPRRCFSWDARVQKCCLACRKVNQAKAVGLSNTKSPLEVAFLPVCEWVVV